MWGGYYVDRVNALIAGTWKADDTWGGFDSGMVAMAPFTNMPDDVKALAEKTEKDIHDKTLNPSRARSTSRTAPKW